MDEEILEALKRANAEDQESGLTIEKLMEMTGRNLDTVVMNVRRLGRDGKAQVSNENHLSNNADHAWPATQSIEVTGEAVAQAKREWKEQNHKPIVVWLGPVILKELEEKRKDDEFREAMKTAAARDSVSVHGGNYGQIAAGDGNKQEQQSFQDLSLQEALPKSTPSTAVTTTAVNSLSVTHKIIIPTIVTVIGGILVLIFWEQIKHLFHQ